MPASFQTYSGVSESYNCEFYESIGSIGRGITRCYEICRASQNVTKSRNFIGFIQFVTFPGTREAVKKFSMHESQFGFVRFIIWHANIVISEDLKKNNEPISREKVTKSNCYEI